MSERSAPTTSTCALQCIGLDAGYSGNPVVRGVNLEIMPGEVVALLGPNGAGKTTLLATFAGLLPILGGTLDVLGSPAPKGNPTSMSRRGVVLVPDDRALFTTLTSRENIQLGRRAGSPTLEQIIDYFPALEKRLDVKAGSLSGGEQQMLAMARGLVQQPKILLIDELSMGLAPIVAENLLPVVRRVAAETGTAVVLVEQHVRLALGIADRAIVLVHGRIELVGAASELATDISVIERAYLGPTTVTAPC
ncbi:MAG: livF [Ilumatobacteraceae bacterium]|nr:livF [Ilumatobacteraceae bacterium]